MNKTLDTPRLSGRVRIPASKSEAHRSLISAALAALYGGSSRPRRVACSDLNGNGEKVQTKQQSKSPEVSSLRALFFIFRGTVPSGRRN